NPRVCLCRPIDAESPTGCADETLLAHIPAGLGLTRGEETDEIRHVAAAHEKPAAIGRVANQFSDPPHGLRFDFRRGRRQDERPDVCVESRRQKIAEDSNWRWRRCDVPEKSRMRIE